jgi:hypothetical protein
VLPSADKSFRQRTAQEYWLIHTFFAEKALLRFMGIETRHNVNITMGKKKVQL